MNRSTILAITDDPSRLQPVLALLRKKGGCPLLLNEPAQVKAAAEDESTDLAVLGGSQTFCEPFLLLFRELHRRQARPPLVVVATGSSEAFAVSSLRAGAVEYLTEPLDIESFTDCISTWLPERPSPCDETELTGGEVLVGASPSMQALRVHIRRLAATACNVLITGETGTGKELVAQLIHQNSARSVHPLICINCAAIPDSLLESELFGYERGAFTGAAGASQGKLMTANRGTVFFDEIGDMSPCAQAKILRAIETKEVQRLGATRKYSTDIRILAATHHDLDDLASAKAFRRDLYFRLNVGRIHLPPLRERKIDIAGLVRRMVLDLNRQLGRRIEGVTNEALAGLTRYDWPGNVRELKNAMERIFIMRDDGRIDAEDLARVLPRPEPRRESAPDEELRTLRRALIVCNGNKSRAAQTLNWSRMTLYRKLAKYKSLDGPAIADLAAAAAGSDVVGTKKSA